MLGDRWIIDRVPTERFTKQSAAGMTTTNDRIRRFQLLSQHEGARTERTLSW